MAFVLFEGPAVKKIDLHHKMLFAIAKVVFETIDGKDIEKSMLLEDKFILEETIDFLIDYTKFHFREEEALMKKHNYSEYQIHQKQHEYLIDQVQKFKKRLMNKNQIQEEFLEFFKGWLISHILTEDRKYSPFLNEKGVF